MEEENDDYNNDDDDGHFSTKSVYFGKLTTTIQTNDSDSGPTDDIIIAEDDVTDDADYEDVNVDDDITISQEESKMDHSADADSVAKSVADAAAAIPTTTTTVGKPTTSTTMMTTTRATGKETAFSEFPTLTNVEKNAGKKIIFYKTNRSTGNNLYRKEM
jgi:hypothetical protein